MSRKPNHATRLLRIVLFSLLPVLVIGSVLLPRVGAESETKQVTISDLSFYPYTLAIFDGDTVVWTNNDSMIHTLWFVRVTDQATYLLSPPIPPGESWSHTFPEAVDLQYFSFDHLWLTGRVTVHPIIHDLAITQLSMVETAAIGETIVINVTIQNQGNVTETFNLTTYVDSTIIQTETGISVNAGQNTTHAFLWNTTGLASGNYTLMAMVSILLEETDTADNIYASGPLSLILHDIAITDIQAAPTTIKRGDIATITLTLLNQGNATEIFDATVYYDTTPIQTQSDISVDAGKNVTLTFIWDTTNVVVGTYTISAKSSQVTGEYALANNELMDTTVTIEAEEAFPTELVLSIAVVIPITGIIAYYLLKKR